jgi:N-acetylneuraminic acid mutarotase
MPTARRLASGAVVDNILYVAGGQIAPVFLEVNILEAYNPATDTWASKASMPTARIVAAADAINGLVYVVGGASAIPALPTNEAYDTTTDSWSAKAPMPTGRHGLVSGAINGVLYAVGGQDPIGNMLTTNEAFTSSAPTPTLPTTTDQCRNGGWQSYGVFKNQGDCVSFVATKGKNPPAE